MTREEHLQWCKGRALGYVDDPQNAVASMASDLSKHPETETHIGIQLGLGLLMSGNLSNPQDVAKWINGFN